MNGVANDGLNGAHDSARAGCHDGVALPFHDAVPAAPSPELAPRESPTPDDLSPMRLLALCATMTPISVVLGLLVYIGCAELYRLGAWVGSSVGPLLASLAGSP